MDLHKEFTKVSDSDVLMDACLLQFPYGIGATNERRKMQDDSFTTRSDPFEYYGHLSRMSQPVFQEPMLQLILYSLISKARILKSSRLQLRGKMDARNLAEGLNSRDVTSCINGRAMGKK